MPSYTDEVADLGGLVVVPTSNMPSGEPLTYENLALLMAGVEFAWTLDTTWTTQWEDVNSSGTLILDLSNMEVVEIIDGTWSSLMEDAAAPFLRSE